MVRIGNLDVAFDLRGIQSIHLNGKDLCGTYPAYASFRRPIRPGELVLEADFGDAWGQRIAAFPSIEKDATQIALGDYHFQVEPLAGAICWRGRYSGGDPMVKNLQWTITCRASADGRRLDFVTEVDWDTRSRRLRVIFPVKSHEKSATYEVPFGFIDRTFDASKLDYSQWSHNAMEFPALHWVRRKIDDRSGVALLNKGLPCNRWIPGRFDLSLLRSPEWAFCAVEPGSYEFWDIDGQRDTGRHRFEYSLWIYDDGVTEADLTRAGYEYNDALPKHPFKLAGDAIVTAFKLAEDGKGWILRLQETAGREPAVSIDFGREVNVVETNLLEKPSGDARRLKQWSGQLRKHEIRTLRLA
jgi:alpha-mannosidase